MSVSLKEKLHQKIEEHRPRTKKLMKDYCDVVVGEITIAQVIGGMRGVKSLVTDISYLVTIAVRLVRVRCIGAVINITA